jgi:hypothetical protein
MLLFEKGSIYSHLEGNFHNREKYVLKVNFCEYAFI